MQAPRDSSKSGQQSFLFSERALVPQGKRLGDLSSALPFQGSVGSPSPQGLLRSCDLTLPSAMCHEEYNGISYVPH